jgi:outer membrane protein OmpA-like peptidoglycan-associated protein
MHVLFPGLLFLLGASGCATRGWVQEQLTPLRGQVAEVGARLGQTEENADVATERMSEIEARLGQTQTRANLAMKNLEHLRLEQHFVLSVKEGTNFAFDSSDLTEPVQQAINGFLHTLNGADEARFLVTGHTDNIGSENYNYELAQRRADNVARYLIKHKSIDPLRVTVMSYGEDAPLADNATPQGRHKNRRVEILVYKETITSTPGGQRLELERTSQK